MKKSIGIMLIVFLAMIASLAYADTTYTTDSVNIR